MAKDAHAQVNWRYAKCPTDADAATFGPFRALVALWQDRAGGGGRLPSRRDFDVFDFREWLGRIFIARIERDPFNVRFVLWGTTLTEWWGVDYTNKALGEASLNPDVWDAVEIAYFREMDRAPFIGVSCGYLDLHDRPHIKVLAVDLPLSDGAGLAHVISAHMQIAPDAGIEEIIPDCPIAADFRRPTG